MKLRKYLKQKNYLMRLFLTIAGFICIPLIIMQILIMERSVQGYAELNEKNIYEKLQENTDSFARQLEDLSYTAIEVSQDSLVRKVVKEHVSKYTIYEAVLKIKEYTNDTWELGIWFHDNNFVLFDKVMITPQRLYERIAGENMEHQREIREFFENSDRMRVTSTVEYSENGVIVVSKPVSFFNIVESDATVFFVNKQEMTEQSYYQKFHDCEGVALLDEAGRFVVKSDVFSSKIYEAEEFWNFLEDDMQLTYTGSEKDKEITVYKYRDIVTGYTSLVAISEDNMKTELQVYVSKIRNTLIVSIMLILLLLGITVDINYKPIKKLTIKHGGKAVYGELSEMGLLDSAFFEVDQKLMNQQKLLANFIIGDLLRGKKVEERLLKEAFPTADHCRSVVVALNGPVINSMQSDKIAVAMKERYGCDIYITGITYRPQILMVCVVYSEIGCLDLQKYIEEVLMEITSFKYDAKCGCMVEKVENIRNSYLKTMVISAEHNEGTHEPNGEIEEAIWKFGEGLHAGDLSITLRLLDNVESCLFCMKESEDIRKYYCYKLLAVCFANQQEGLDLNEERERLLAFSDTRQLFEMLQQSIERQYALLNEKEQSEAEKLGKKLLTYVDTNFNNRNLGLTSAADYLGTSIYVVSRLFKAATGRGFKEYVMEKRLEYARELLCISRYSVTEITSLSGFEKTEYFSSIFKAKYGLPPTQYRKEYMDNA